MITSLQILGNEQSSSLQGNIVSPLIPAEGDQQTPLVPSSPLLSTISPCHSDDERFVETNTEFFYSDESSSEPSSPIHSARNEILRLGRRNARYMIRVIQLESFLLNRLK